MYFYLNLQYYVAMTVILPNWCAIYSKMIDRAAVTLLDDTDCKELDEGCDLEKFKHGHLHM